MSAVALDDVTLAIGERIVLANVSLAIETGEFVGVLGPNGAGKTTFLRAVLGLLPVRSGTIRVLGAPVQRGQRSLAYMPQVRSFTAGQRLSGWDFVACAI